jgi:Flp pilus assembly protein TadG
MSKQSEPIGTRRRTGLPAGLLAGLPARFLRNSSGSTAIEFSMLAIPFAALVFAILETCISFAAQQVMSNVTDDIARQIRTGQLKPGPALTETALKTMICDKLDVIVSPTTCQEEVEVDLQMYTTFAAAAAVRIEFADGDINTTGFYPPEPGESMSINMLRVFYRWPVITDFMSMLDQPDEFKVEDRKTLHFATVTWQNEPFDD